MKYLLGFLRFWRNFIIGDDPTIAITVMWSFLAVYALIKISAPGWYVVPLVVAVLFIVVFAQSLRKFAQQHKKTKRQHISSFHAIDALWAPMAAVVIIPFCFFRLETLDFSIERMFLPVVTLCSAIALSALVIAPRFARYPALTSCIAAVISFALIAVTEAPMLQFFGIVAAQMPVGNLLLLAITIVGLTVLVRKILRLRETTK